MQRPARASSLTASSLTARRSRSAAVPESAAASSDANNACPPGGPDVGVDGVLGVRHQPDDVARVVAHAGDRSSSEPLGFVERFTDPPVASA